MLLAYSNINNVIPDYIVINPNMKKNIIIDYNIINIKKNGDNNIINTINHDTIQLYFRKMVIYFFSILFFWFVFIECYILYIYK
jgi:hypothetical protein